MSILAANLKHLYQRRGYWLTYSVFGLLSYWIVIAAVKYSGMREIDMIMSGMTGIFTFMIVGKAHFMGLVLLALPVGLCAAAVPIEILTKPFSYCLPGHRIVPVKFILSLGILFNMLGSFIFLAYPDLHGWERVPVLCAAFGAGMMMYWLGVLFAWRIRYSVVCLSFLPAVFIIPRLLNLYAIAQQMIIESPFEIAGLGALCSLAGFWLLVDPNQARRFCGVSRLGFLDAWNRNKVEKFWQSRAAGKKDRLKGHPHPWVEEFFLNRMNSCGYLRAGRPIWGGLYTTFAVALSMWKSYIFWLLFGWFFCYINSDGTFLSFLLIIVMVVRPVSVHTNVFPTGGRKERFITAGIVAGTIAVITTAMIITITFLSVRLEPLMPEITLWKSMSVTFHALNIRSSFFLIIVMPIALTIHLVLYQRPALRNVSIVMLFMFAVAIPDILLISDEPTVLSMLLEPIVQPIPIATFVVSSWFVFVLVLWYFCMKRPLVGQSRTY